MAVDYGYAVGTDPTYDAYASQYDYTKSQDQADADLKRKQQQLDYQQAIASLAQQQTTGARNIDTAMLGRNVFSSGETNRRQAELGASLLTARGAADQAYANQSGSIDNDLQRALTTLALQREQQIAAANERQAVAAKPVAAPQAAAAAPSRGYVPVPKTQKAPMSNAQKNSAYSAAAAGGFGF